MYGALQTFNTSNTRSVSNFWLGLKRTCDRKKRAEQSFNVSLCDKNIISRDHAQFLLYYVQMGARRGWMHDQPTEELRRGWGFVGGNPHPSTEKMEWNEILLNMGKIRWLWFKKLVTYSVLMGLQLSKGAFSQVSCHISKSLWGGLIIAIMGSQGAY